MIEEIKQTEEIKLHKMPGPFLAPGLIYPISYYQGMKRITKAIAEAWEIPENQVLGNTEVIRKKWHGSKSNNGLRPKVKGERIAPYVNARKFYFYVMVTIKKYPWYELTMLTGRKIAAMQYAIRRAEVHMRLEKDYRRRANMVLDLINEDRIIYPTIKPHHHAATTERNRVY